MYPFLIICFNIVSVLVHPLVEVPNQLVGAPVGTNVSLVCNVEASPKAINYWQKENGKNIMKIIYVILVQIPNCVLKYWQWLFCSQLVFVFLGEMIIANDRYTMTEIENSIYAVQMGLFIKRLHKSDFGGYKCTSKNSIGDAEGTIRLYG